MYTKQHITSFTNDHIIEKRNSYNVTYINRPIYARNNWVLIGAAIFSGVMTLFLGIHIRVVDTISDEGPFKWTFIAWIFSAFLWFTLWLFVYIDKVEYSSIKIPAYMGVLFYLYHVILLLIIAAAAICVVLVIDHTRRAAIAKTDTPYSPYLKPIAISIIILIILLILIQVIYIVLARRLQKKITA